MKKRSVFWGVVLVAAGVLLVASQITGFAAVSGWSIAATVFLAACLIKSLTRLNFVGILLSGVLLYVVWQVPLGFPQLSLWLLIVAAIVGGIGLSMIFRRRPAPDWETRQIGRGHHPYNKEYTQLEDNEDDNNPYASVKFGGSSRYLHSTALKTGEFHASFGSLEVYFDQARLDEAGAEIFCDCSFGNIKLFVPRNWLVRDSVNASIGGVTNETRFARPDENSPTLLLTGNVQFGAVEVEYV